MERRNTHETNTVDNSFLMRRREALLGKVAAQHTEIPEVQHISGADANEIILAKLRKLQDTAEESQSSPVGFILDHVISLRRHEQSEEEVRRHLNRFISLHPALKRMLEFSGITDLPDCTIDRKDDIHYLNT